MNAISFHRAPVVMTTPQAMDRRTIASLASVVFRYATRVTLACTLAVLPACHGLLTVTDPTRVQDSDIANAAGANARRLSVAYTFNQSLSKTVTDVAVFSDELTIDGQYGQYDLNLSRRNGAGYEAQYTRIGNQSNEDPHLGTLDNIVTTADIALPKIHAYTPDSLKGDFLAQLFALRGYAVVQMAEDVCSGFPINHVASDNSPLYGPGFTTDSATKYGIAQLDSALTYVHDSTQFRYFAQVTRGRALLDIGQYAAAAAAVAGVPTGFTYFTEGNNGIYDDPSRYAFGIHNLVVTDSEGVNGLPFLSSHDPRVTTVAVGLSYNKPGDSAYYSTKYHSYYDPILVSSGIEARLIEAEAAINAGDGSWLTAVNTLRETVGLGDLSDPGSRAARIDLLYRERAFWLYLTGRRLGDMRRLVNNYGRDPNTVFPIGPTGNGANYGTSTAIPFIFATEKSQNPYITSGCASP